MAAELFASFSYEFLTYCSILLQIIVTALQIALTGQTYSDVPKICSSMSHSMKSSVKPEANLPFSVHAAGTHGASYLLSGLVTSVQHHRFALAADVA